jgi:O-methyltransferase
MISTSPGPESLYLDLMKKVLTRDGFGQSFRTVHTGGNGIRNHLTTRISRLLALKKLHLVRKLDPQMHGDGRTWSVDAETMIGRLRLDNLQACIVDVIERGVDGDLIETGVWRGGATIFMRAVLKAYGVSDRVVWVADSFQGLPKPDAGLYPADADDPHWRATQLAVPLDVVKANFARYELLDDQVRFLPGWFRDTLPTAPMKKLSILRLDGDMYESTMVALRNLYPKLEVGGYAIIDDYGAVAGCRQAVEEFRAEQGITEELREIDWAGAFWQREA